MKKLVNNFFLTCGLLLTLAAFPVFAQDKLVEDNKKPLEERIIINLRPLQEFTVLVDAKIQKKEVDLNAPFSVELNGVLTQEGRFDAKKSAFAKSNGNEPIIEIVKRGLEAISDSGLLSYFYDLGIEKLLITAKQDDKTLTVQFVSELPTEAKARTIGSGMNSLISIGKIQIKDEDLKSLLNSLQVINDDKKFVLNFSISKVILQEITLRNLKKYNEKVQKQSAGK